MCFMKSPGTRWSCVRYTEGHDGGGGYVLAPSLHQHRWIGLNESHKKCFRTRQRTRPAQNCRSGRKPWELQPAWPTVCLGLWFRLDRCIPNSLSEETLTLMAFEFFSKLRLLVRKEKGASPARPVRRATVCRAGLRRSLRRTQAPPAHPSTRLCGT